MHDDKDQKQEDPQPTKKQPGDEGYDGTGGSNDDPVPRPPKPPGT